TTVSGVPGLSNIPGLKYFFSDTKHEKKQTDVLIMLTPRIIRLPESSVEAAAAQAPAQPVTGPSTPAASAPARPALPTAQPSPEPPSPGRPPQRQ
ncbi:MAG TPA: hypothetical protein VFJ52_00365, partial [Terriglobia bacterium]|nr:hypothetical protein [Terriglobia bacterium]